MTTIHLSDSGRVAALVVLGDEDEHLAIRDALTRVGHIVDDGRHLQVDVTDRFSLSSGEETQLQVLEALGHAGAKMSLLGVARCDEHVRGRVLRACAMFWGVPVLDGDDARDLVQLALRAGDEAS